MNSVVIEHLSNAQAVVGLNPDPVPVIFDNAYQSALGGLVESSGPQCIGRTSDLAAAVQGVSIVIGGTSYRVRGNQPDGTGVTTLELERAS